MRRQRPELHHNLPVQRTQLIGRERDVVAVRKAILGSEGNLVTLTGVGGCGKTRLALQVAHDLVGVFTDGVWLAELAPLTESSLVAQTVATALGVQDQPSRPILDTLVASLKSRRLLLLLDNCEHVIEACARLTDVVLAACPDIRVLATSRESLDVRGETTWRVPSLSVPDQSQLDDVGEIARSPAVRLFVERGRAVQQSFELTRQNAHAVVEVCTRLEGLPLAIELAAARLRGLGPEEIRQRLDDVFRLLVGGSRTAPKRQQTLRATLEWSHALLSEGERAVFRQVSVFAGGWSLEAAESVCATERVARADVLEALIGLANKSLVVVDDRRGRARYRLLEPVRQYAHEQLTGNGDIGAVQRRHAQFFLSLAEELELRRWNYGETSRDALDVELANLRLALQWSVEYGEAEIGLRLNSALFNYWLVRGYFDEGKTWPNRLLAISNADVAPAVRAAGLGWIAFLAWHQGDYAVAKELYAEALPFLKKGRLTVALGGLGFISQYQGNYEAAHAYFDQSRANARAAGDRIGEGLGLSFLAQLACQWEDYATARALCEEVLPLFRRINDSWALGKVLTTLGSVLLQQGELTAARSLLEECLVVQRRVGERWELANALDVSGQLAIRERDYAEAQDALCESLRLRRELGDRLGVAESLESVAVLAAAQGSAGRAFDLAEAAAALRDLIGARLSPKQDAMLHRWIGPVRQMLEAESTTRGSKCRLPLPLDDAVELVLGSPNPLPAHAKLRDGSSADHDGGALSPRETEVAALVLEGLTNRQIAQRLQVTERTVAAHVEHILDKLDFSSRTQIGVWAAERRARAPSQT
jgi:non-specific serine/threonine protein kinase